MPDLRNFVGDWPNKEFIEGKSFNQLFQLEGVPLEWFYKRCFLTHIIPKYVFPAKSLSLEPRKRLLLRELKCNIYVLLLSKYLLLKERRKWKTVPKKTSFSPDRKVLFLTYPYHLSKEGKIFRLEEVINEVKKDTKIKDLILFVDPLSRNDYKKALGKELFYQYYDEELEKTARSTAKELAERWKNISEQEKRKLLEKDGYSFWPFFKPAFNLYFSEEMLFILILYYEMFKKSLIVENVGAAIITGSSTVIERCLLAAAEKLKVNSVAIVHGVWVQCSNRDINDSTKILVFNEYHQKCLENTGMKNEIIAIGPVIYDEIYLYIKMKKKNTHNLLWATSPLLEANRISKKEYIQRLDIVLKQINEIPQVKLTFKLHPRDVHPEIYNFFVQKYPWVHFLPANTSREEFYAAISKSDLFINCGSNSALEAMIIGRPVLTIDFFEDGSLSHWMKGSKVNLEVGYMGKIKEVIEKTIQDSPEMKTAREEIVLARCGKIDGKASKRAAKLILKWTKENIN